MVGLFIVGIVLWGTWSLLRDSVHLILDAVPRYIDQHGVSEYLHNIKGVSTVHDLHIWGLSTREVALTAHLVMPADQLSDEEFRHINEVLHQKFKIDHVTLQIERGTLEDICVRTETC